MSHTVVGIFKSATDAQHAASQLINNGFAEGKIDISSGSTNQTNSSSNTTSTTDENESGIGRFFKNLFGTDDDESGRYARVAERGSVVTVHASSESEAQTAATMLDQFGAVDVDDDDSSYSANNKSAASTTIPVIEENLLVGKKEIETGGVRLRSRIVERPVEESLRLREEHVRVERKTVDLPATDADLDSFKEGTIELTEQAEIPVVSKEARIIEEVSLGKDVEHREETIRDTVRKTEVDVEEIEVDNNKRKNF